MRVVAAAPRFAFALARIVPQEGANLLGTCFGVGGNRLVTAAHVVGGSDQNLVVVVPRNNELTDYQDTTITQINSGSAQIERIDPVRDVCILTVKWVPGYFPLDAADSVGIGDQVVTLGFPHADAGRLVLTQQVAQVGARVLVGASGLKLKHMILNLQARPGQSGGPVINPENGKVVAMLVGGFKPVGGGGINLGGIDPWTLHQTTHAISAEYISEVLR